MSEDSVEQPEAKLPTCNICNKSFAHKNSLRQHREQTKHASTDTDGAESVPGEEVPKRFGCTMCNRSFKKEYWLFKHMITKHAWKVPDASVKPAEDAKPSPTSQDPAVDSDAPIKQEDLKQEDQDQDSVPTVFSCAVCGKTFNGQVGLDQHTNAKHNPKPEEGKVNCEWCRKSFVDDRALQNHRKDKHSQVCTYCKKGFGTKAALEEHKRDTRHPERTTEPAGAQSRRQKEKVSEPSPQRFKCDFCSSTFHHFDLLEQHVIRHNLWSDDGPVTIYKCDFCPKTFYSYDELDEHMRTTYRFNSPNSWDSDGQTDEEDYEEDYEDSDEESDGEEAEDSDEENNEESDEENDEESIEEENEENDEESDKESVPDLVENTGENSTERLAAELPPAPFKCQDCDETFYYTAALGEHQEMFAHGPMAIREKKPEPAAGPSTPEFKCRDCDEAFHHFTMLLEHQEKAGHGSWAAEKSKPAEKPAEKPVEKPVEKPTVEGEAGNDSISVYKCTDCGRLYRDVNWFLVHLSRNHGRRPAYYYKYLTKVAPEEADAPAKKVTSGFRCRPCNEPFRNQYLLAKHWEKTHEDAWWALFDKYNISGESISYSDFRNFDNYNENDMLDDLRQINSWSSKKKNMIPCITCWKKFKTTSQMVEHVEMRECHSYIAAHSIKWAVHRSDQSVVSRCYSDDKFQCPGCEARFDCLSSLLRHAEGNKCRADVAQGPIKAFMTEVRWRMVEGEIF
ncbi:hypothetical protein FMUND_4300 [Fusarium mundagurra]|uniref:C2H2-type domain-containing protein n=1 Tax=Fusarium mundagurra TaxID=1567541 RepID=A0A8H6DJZ8_9HYPO|nr:hypothetical protein FMUND_4300 [Fusarium mundagurra]